MDSAYPSQRLYLFLCPGPSFGPPPSPAPSPSPQLIGTLTHKGSKPTAIWVSSLSSVETDALVNILDIIQRLSREEWEAEHAEQSKYFVTIDTQWIASGESSHHYDEKMLLEGPFTPKDVRKAKKFRQKLIEQAEIGYGQDDVDELTTFRELVENHVF